MSTPAENKAKALRLWEQALNKRDYSVIPEIDSPKYTFNGQPQTFQEIEAFIDWIESVAPGYHFTVNSAVAEGNTVSLLWEIAVPAGNKLPQTNGQAAHGVGANFLTFENGLIVANNQAGGVQDVAPVGTTAPAAGSTPAPVHVS